MTAEAFRSFLYPLGFVASLLFSARVLMQWIGSEKKKKSHVTHTFWIVSLAANAIMTVHSFIQLQYPVCLIQALNGVIAWRNLSLMQESNRSWKSVISLMGFVALGITLLFALQGWWLQNSSWMLPSSLPWEKAKAQHVFWVWHGIGILGITLFASRFWVQWWCAEKQKISELGKSFWWISLIGSSLSVCYFYHLHDLVNLIGYSTGLLPYLRNLILLKKPSSSPPSKKHPSLFVFAGEQSGDLLGSGLLKALKEKHPALRLYGVGGGEMRRQGLECVIPMEKFQVMGVSDVLKASPRLFTSFHHIKNTILKDRPDGVVLIDYPDFNMLLEKALRKNGYQGKLIHYVCPTVWAWRASRVKTLAKTVDLLLSIFPFEKECFAHTSLPVAFVGHPLVSEIEAHSYQEDWKRQCGIPSDLPVVAIFPGSRPHEIASNLPIQIEAALRFCRLHNALLVISVARPDLQDLIYAIAEKTRADSAFFLVPALFRYELMKEALLAFATSGTITLELGLHSTPTVMTYKLNPLNYFLGKYLFRIRLPHICIVNIILKKTVFPECVARTLSADHLFQKACTLFAHQEECHQSCEMLKQTLKGPCASQQAAEEICDLVGV